MTISGKRHAFNLTKKFLRDLEKSGQLFFKDFDSKDRRMISHLNKKEIIEIIEINGVTTIHLTRKGKQKILKYQLEELKIIRPDKWDKKWRIVVFDIPEKFKVARNVLKRKLDELGFIKIQKSVYVHPFECSNEIEFIRILYRIRPFVSIIIADEIENSEKLKRKFGI